jgi:4-hydroxythreonine-4-phosphate dehydrogenase
MIPPLALSLGEPAGIGPEIVARAWAALRREGPAFMVVGDAALVEAAGVPVGVVSGADGAVSVFADAVPVLHRPTSKKVEPGRPDPTNAACVVDWIAEAVQMAATGRASGIVTAPIAKAPLYAAGFPFPGHTEFIADITGGLAYEGTRGPVMMLTAKDLRVALVTIHAALSQVPELVTAERVIRTARVVHEALRRDFGVAKPRLALAGLNPHAGESGSIGLEEVEVLRPAAAALRAEGVAVTDPLPADTMFHDEARKAYDAAICLYHDQALIPVKTIDFWGGVNVTLGLPVVRTSPDHGTGFEIAGKGIARPDSLIAALRLAGEMAARRTAAA